MALEEIQKIVALMRFELECGNVDGTAKLLDYHLELSKKVDAGSSDTLLDQIFSSIEDLINENCLRCRWRWIPSGYLEERHYQTAG